MGGIGHYFALVAKSRTGLGPNVVILGLLALITAAAAVIFFVVAGYIVLADTYSPLTAALILGGAFLLLAILAAVLCLMAQRRVVQHAKVALAARTSAMWLEPKMLAVGVDLVRSIGLRRLVPLAAIGVIAGGLAREWIARPGEKPASPP
jgi:hypothetical protein